jgi:hypothetical protein
MTTKINTENGTVEVPTATEFIPKSEVHGQNAPDAAMIRGLQRVTDGKGLECAYHEPHHEPVENYVYICDECGHSEDTEDAIEHHLRTEHEN